jgi:hypothetical protein
MALRCGGRLAQPGINDGLFAHEVDSGGRHAAVAVIVVGRQSVRKQTPYKDTLGRELHEGLLFDCIVPASERRVGTHSRGAQALPYR